MSGKWPRWLALLLSLQISSGCMGRSYAIWRGGGVAQPPAGFVAARAFPEILLRLKGSQNWRSGKIVGLEKNFVLFEPAPYWNAETRRIDVSDVESIILKKKRTSPGTIGGYVFGLSTIVLGIQAGTEAKYDRDFEEALIWAPLAGALFGLIGAGIAGRMSPPSEVRYELSAMSDEERTYVIFVVMGLRR